jgi:hypothetical protein
MRAPRIPARDNPLLKVNKYASPTMNKPSERIVVFVSPAQKRAITATADQLGISISELMRRAVLSFGATSEQIKAASIVDRLRAPREPDALNEALQRLARSARHAQQAAATVPASAPAAAVDASVPESSAPDSSAPLPVLKTRAVDRSIPDLPGAADSPSAPLDPIAAVARQAPDDAADSAAQAAARIAAAKAATLAANACRDADEEDVPRIDSSAKTGRFA